MYVFNSIRHNLFKMSVNIAGKPKAFKNYILSNDIIYLLEKLPNVYNL